MPIGYKMVEGKIQIDKEKASTVKKSIRNIQMENPC